MRIAEIIYDAATRLGAVASDDEARLEAEVLLAHSLGVDRAHLLARLDEQIDDPAHMRFDALFARRLAHEPLAYIIGHREFYGIEIACAPGALIPRPETEMLVELALSEIRSRGAALRIVDVGTGSGAIAIAIAASATAACVIAIDHSDAALAVARLNAERTGVAARIDLRRGDLLDGHGEFDVIVANLPYVSAREWESLPPEFREHEPREALVGGEAGTEAIERLLDQAPPHMAPGAMLAAEIGASQAEHLLAMARRHFPDAETCVMKDLAGLDRVLVVRTGG